MTTAQQRVLNGIGAAGEKGVTNHELCAALNHVMAYNTIRRTTTELLAMGVLRYYRKPVKPGGHEFVFTVIPQEDPMYGRTNA